MDRVKSRQPAKNNC